MKLYRLSEDDIPKKKEPPKEPEFHADDEFGVDEAERKRRKEAKQAKIKAAWDELNKAMGK
jgi:hypothetical protein